MRISVDQSPVGAGKTYNALKNAIVSGGRWLFAVERIQSIDELADLAAHLKKQFSIKCKVVSVSSASNSSTQKRGESVRIQIEALPEQYSAGNIIAFVTHEAILKCDFRDFAGWHFVCDEVPSILHIEKMKTKLDRAFFEEHYELEAIHGEWSLIKPTDAGRKLSGSDLAQCDSHVRLQKMHETVVGYDEDRIPQAPLCNLVDWADTEGDSVSWVWWSQFSFSHLSFFKSASVLASRFFDSFTYRIAQKWEPKIVWLNAPQLPNRSFKQRPVSIVYFSQQQLAAKSFFTSPTGQQQLAMIGQHIAKATASSGLIWSSNESIKAAIETSLPKSSYYKPRQAGTSLLMNNDAAAMIYAAKPSHEVQKVLDAIDASPIDWVRTVEHETILQFVSRTSVRDPDSMKPVRIFVYDQSQAETIADFFRAQSHNLVDLDFVDLGLPVRTTKFGRPRKERTHEEVEHAAAELRKKRAEQQRRRRAQKRLDEAGP